MTDETGAGEGMQIDVDLVRQLAVLLDDTNLTEIEVEDGSRKIRVARKAAPPPPAMFAHAAPAPAAAPQPAGPAPAPAGSVANTPAPPSVSPADHPGAIKSPMVGTAYLAAEPGAEPFIAIGTRVAAGDTLLIVEAMKVMNPIPAPRAGTISQLFIENGQPIEFDQPLLVIE